MDFWSRLIGGSYAPKDPPKSQATSAQARLARFTRAYTSVVHLCNKPRSLANEAATLDELQRLFDKLTQLIREESRSPAPHLCLQYAATNQIYAATSRAAVVSHHEGVIHSTISLLATLIDSDEEDFLSSQPFAKSLMRLVTRVVDSGALLLGIETETAILELLFTIAAKIRLQPSILPVWFASTAKPELEDVFVKEKRNFVGITQKEDFPLCYLLTGRVHHEGRIGDFARTGLLYIFEATGRSTDLEEWTISSDLPTLMASGLGALYSQLSRELSILHPDATLPAVLAMSDYSTTHARATAESAFSERHQAHIATFLSYLAFWQDVLDHCRSADVKQTLLDHFQILFLQQLLYPSILQSSDTDAGSSVAVLTYVTTILEALEYPDLVHNILAYLLAIPDAPRAEDNCLATPQRPNMPPRSPTTVKRRQNLMLLTAPKNPDDAMEPTLFNLIDLITNSLSSSNPQTVYAALNLSSTILTRLKKYAFATLLKVRPITPQDPDRTVGALELEIEKYADLSLSLHDVGVDEAYGGLADDVRLAIEAQIPLSSTHDPSASSASSANTHSLPKEDAFMRLLSALMRTFFTNSVDVNLALTQALVSIALCTEIRLDTWFALEAAHYTIGDDGTSLAKPLWQDYLDDEEKESLSALQSASRRPAWHEGNQQPIIYTTLQSLSRELDAVRTTVPSLDQLISGRKNMLQSASLNAPVNDPHSIPGSPMPARFEVSTPKQSRGHSRDSSTSSLKRGRKKPSSASAHASLAPSPAGTRPSDPGLAPSGQRSFSQPPPPESPSTTDLLMQKISFADHKAEKEAAGGDDDVIERPPSVAEERSASLNHVLTNVVILQEFVLELVAVLQIRAAVLGEREVRFTA